LAEEVVLKARFLTLQIASVKRCVLGTPLGVALQRQGSTRYFW
jgi:hypothetical protein